MGLSSIKLSGFSLRSKEQSPQRQAASLSLLDWSLTHRIINGQPFTVIPALRQLYTTTHPRVVVRKAAQVFASEWLINTALWVADTRQGGRGNSLYVFPTAEQLGDFSRARVDKAIEESPHLSRQAETPANVGLKRIGFGHLYMRGSTKRNMIISVDADCVLADEVAEYSAGTITVLEKRLGSSLLGWVRAGSTPRYPADEAGQLWDQSTQCAYHVRCSHCGVSQPLAIETHLQPDTGQVCCQHCHGDMSQDRLGEGEWVPAKPDMPWEGYQLTKLLSPRVDLAALAATYRDVLDGRATQSKVQEFWNSDAGRSYLPEGGHVSPSMLDACIEPDSQISDTAKGAYMGIDVGGRQHVVILARDGERFRLLHAASYKTFGELDLLMARYDVHRAVIDGHPETIAAEAFAQRWPGRVFLAGYPNFAAGQLHELCHWDDTAHTVKINRTLALDTTQTMVATRTLILPRNARELGAAVDTAGYGEFYRHMGAPIRVLVTDAHGNPVARYEENGADHFAHACVYARVAIAYPRKPQQVLAMGAASGGWGKSR